MSDRVRFTVERSNWDRGNKNGSLLGSRGMCCLGFLGQACGLPPDQLRDNGLPEEVTPAYGESPWPESILRMDDEKGWCNTRLVSDLVEVNDDDKIDEEVRERELTKLFLRGNIEVEFVP